jgi:hypothetical protein
MSAQFSHVCSTLYLLLLGSRRKGKEVAGGVLASSSWTIPISDEDPIDVGGGGINSNEGYDSRGHAVDGQDGNDGVEVVAIDQDEPPRKRSKKCTSDVWPYFTKKDVIVEVDGKKLYSDMGALQLPEVQGQV